jgi:hypothetical protein
MDYNMKGISELFDPIVIALWEINFCTRNERRSVDLYKASGMEEGWNRRQLSIKAIAQMEVHSTISLNDFFVLFDPIVTALWEIRYYTRNERRSVDFYNASGGEEGWNRRQLGIKAIARMEVHLALAALGLAPYQISDRRKVFTFTEWDNIHKAGEGTGKWEHMEKTFAYFTEFEERIYQIGYDSFSMVKQKELMELKILNGTTLVYLSSHGQMLI